MKNELIQEYTARVSQSNRSQLVVVVYDIILEYLGEATEAASNGDDTVFISSVKRAQNCLADLMGALDYNYPISGQLFSLYSFWNRRMVSAIVKNSAEYLSGLEGMIKKMRDAFEKVSEEDSSSPLMQNTQKVYAGLTYGRQSLSEMTDMDSNRGFQA